LDTNELIREGDTLQAFLPIVIGDRLRLEIKEKMIGALKDTTKFNCNFGLATEASDSEFYEYNGYWRGPVWAPVMLIFIESLFRMGETDFAKDLARRFLRAPAQAGMSENFDPITGEGLVDTGFAWTSAVFLTLLRDEKVF
jgi:glycogen debranching enzyme